MRPTLRSCGDTRRWAGTETGLWETTDEGRTWMNRLHGLPPDILVAAFHLRDGRLAVAAYGRGVFSLPIAEMEALRTGRQRKNLLPDRAAFTLQPNWPNPFGRQTTVQSSADEQATVQLDNCNASGRLVTTLNKDATTPAPRAGRFLLLVPLLPLCAAVSMLFTQACQLLLHPRYPAKR